MSKQTEALAKSAGSRPYVDIAHAIDPIGAVEHVQRIRRMAYAAIVDNDPGINTKRLYIMCEFVALAELQALQRVAEG